MIRKDYFGFSVAAVALVLAAPVRAADAPIYAANPAWVVPHDLPRPSGSATSANSAFVLFDQQSRIEGDTVYQYTDTAFRIVSAEMMSALGTLTSQWQPDTQSFTVHSITITRDGKAIDVLANGNKFDVLRRETQLEQMGLDGALTATMALKDLRIGDIVRFRQTLTTRDPSLGGHVNGQINLPAQPMSVAAATSQLSWPEATQLQHKLPASAKPVVDHIGTIKRITLTGLLPKAEDMPEDAPARFKTSPALEFSSFSDWPQVSRIASKHYEDRAAIAPGSSLAAEIAKIAKASTDPVERLARAVRIVQDDVRYLYVGLDNGNYVPQEPADTWSKRYGDCKAKTLLLMSMLRELGITADPVLVSSQNGDGLRDRLPGYYPFDHVIVRARAGGTEYWIDGTVTGTRKADLSDVPNFHYALPLTATGSELVKLPLRAKAEAAQDQKIAYDLTAGLGFPALFDLTMTLRGPEVAMIKAIQSGADAKTLNDMLDSIANGSTHDGIVIDRSISFTADGATATVKAHGISNYFWRWDERRYQTTFETPISSLSFDVDRNRPAWRDIPVVTPHPQYSRQDVTLRLSKADTGAGFALDGPRDFATQIGGFDIDHHYTVDENVVHGSASLRTRVDEIPAAELPAIRQQLARAQAEPLRLMLPPTIDSKQAAMARAKRAGKLKALYAAYDAYVDQAPKDDATTFQNRAAFYAGIDENAKAAADVGRMIEIDPSADNHLWRARLLRKIDRATALKDISAAQAIDPSSLSAFQQSVQIGLDTKDFDAAQSALDYGGGVGIDRKQVAIASARVLAAKGEGSRAIATLDAALDAFPANSELYAARCALRAERSIDPAAGLKDCTRAVELDDSPAELLVKRGLAYWRLDRKDDAVGDWNAALAIDPDTAGAWYMRGLAAGSNSEAGKHDLEVALLIDPDIANEYAEWGLKP
jgi:transglutaminase-like putative cysteine protease/tetratricopeptide (TPR) repeat protein